MSIPESSLSVAIQGLAEFLAGKFTEDVLVTVDSPQKAQEQAKDSDTQILNIFTYRIAPSGFHASEGDEDPFFIRANILLTAFPSGKGNPEPDVDLRVLGHAVRVLQSFPVIPVTFPGPVPAGAPASDFRRNPTTSYQMQAVFQAPTMEEMNHIWTTQGGELAYRLSAGYELALIPIEPLTHAAPAPQVTSPDIVLAAGPAPRPFQMFENGGRLFSHVTLSSGTAQTSMVLTGVPQSHVALHVEWTRNSGSIERQDPQFFEVKTADVDTPAARINLALSAAADGDVATIAAIPSSDDGTPIAGRAAGNLIHLSIGAP
jgi:hypothetical protein